MRRKLNFTSLFIKILCSYQVFFKQDGNVVEWDAFLKPFGKFVWRLILLWFLVSAFALNTFYRIGVLRQGESPVYLWEFSKLNAFLTFLRAFCQQGKKTKLIIVRNQISLLRMSYNSYNAFLPRIVPNRLPDVQHPPHRIFRVTHFQINTPGAAETVRFAGNVPGRRFLRLDCNNCFNGLHLLLSKITLLKVETD